MGIPLSVSRSVIGTFHSYECGRGRIIEPRIPCENATRRQLVFFCSGFSQRTFAARTAISLRCSAFNLTARALPPFRPPSFPRAIALWSLPALRSSRGAPSICSPMACSTIPRATSMKSRFGADFFGMAPSCHGIRIDGKCCGNHTDPLPSKG